MRKRQPEFGHHLHQIAEAELKAQIPAHTQDDDLAVKVPPENRSPMLFSSPIGPLPTTAKAHHADRLRRLHQSPTTQVGPGAASWDRASFKLSI